MKKIIKKVMILLCGFILLMTFSWNKVVFAEKTKYASYAWKDIKEAYEKDKNVVNKLSAEDVECWQKEIKALQKLMMSSPESYQVYSSQGIPELAAEISNALTARKASLNQSKASDDEKKSIEDRLIKAIKDKDVKESNKILTEEMDLNARKKFKKNHASDYKSYIKLLEDTKQSDEYIKQQKLLFDKEVDEVQEELTGDVIYNSIPQKEDTNNASESIDDVINDGDQFIEKGKSKGDLDNLSKVSNKIYNILLTVGVIIAVLVGAILGIKLMLSGIEEKAEVKKLLVSYVIGCIVIFGGFGIWKIVVSLLQSL